eukprot:TRINITY_DN11850_c0_g1_i1.p1 TRINITY_DN11850_c0_g1~~TRINITY_DN11850_c0_g1_i1.p1  ORF type:complete len:313 (-),score=88.08 TRINITY_DN11850_c0_g1_i1:28-909(-)
MSLQDELLRKQTQLKPTTTIVKPFPKGEIEKEEKEDNKKIGRHHAVLILGKGHYEWFYEDSKLFLFCSKGVYENIPPEVAEKYEQIEWFEHYETSPMVEWKAIQLHRKVNFTHVVALGEVDLLRARLREKFGLGRGQLVASATRYRDKVEMKKFLQQKGIRVPRFGLAQNASQVSSFIESFGYPVVIKPVKGFGSVNTSIIRSEEDLVSFFTQVEQAGWNSIDSSWELEIEEFVSGDFYHIDGLVFNNSPTLIWPSKYTNTVVNFSSNRNIAAYALHPLNPVLCVDTLSLIHI